MSSTYVIAKSAAACVDENGVLYYLLSEESYASNDHPRTPHWCARFFGRYEDCMARMIVAGSAIEGGSLKGEARTSTAWIKQWRDRLANPVRLTKKFLTLRFSSSFYDVPVASRDQVAALAAKHGQPLPEDNVLTIDMERAGALPFIAELLNSEIPAMYVWKLFRNAEQYRHALLEPGLGTPAPKAPPVKLDEVEVYQIKAPTGGDHDHFIRINGEVRATGWEYSTMGSFICREVLDADQVQPGAAEPMIHAFRKLVASPKPMPMTARIKVSKPQSDDDSASYHARKLGEFCAAVGVPLVETSEFTFQDVVNAGLAGALRYLNGDSVTFQIGDSSSETPALQPQEQLLLA